MKNLKTRIKDRGKFEISLTPPFPRNMLVELTNACNHRCVFCGNSKKTRKTGHINEDLLAKILTEAFALGTREVGFYTTGEPFLSPNLAKYVALVKKIGFEYVYLDTNGALATPERAVPVIEAGLDSIKFSINAGTPETYKATHGFDDFNKVISNLEFISNYRNQHGKPAKIYASFVVTPQNQNERERLKEIVGPLVDDINFSEVENQGGTMVAESQSMATAKSPSNKKTMCYMLFNRFHITWEGYLTACCIDFNNNLLVADLNKTSLKEAWHGETFVNLRKRHMDNNLTGILCYNCLNNKNGSYSPYWAPAKIGKT
jgi:wyosine [tRNA(Phe)-imidazoG37] synthetase (radical SAM superfamily)